MMKNRVWALAVALTLSAVSATSSFADAIRDNIPGEGGDRATYLSVGPGLAILNGNVGWALNVGLLKGTSEKAGLFWGADLGMNFYGGPSIVGPGIASGGATSLQLLPTVVYRFDLGGDNSIFPYIGVSAGPNVFFGSASTNLYFELLARPGFFTAVSKDFSLNAEAKLGVLGGDFIFLPQANLVFSI